MNQLLEQWLATLCTLTAGVGSAVVLLKNNAQKGYSPAVFWPGEPDDYQHLVEAAKASLKKQSPILVENKVALEGNGEPHDLIACPILIDDQTFGVVAVQIGRQIPAKQQVALRQITEGTGWFEAILKQRSLDNNTQLVNIIELVASCLEHEQFREAITDVATDLTRRISSDRVSIGFVGKKGAVVEAVSHSAGFDKKSNFIRDIGEAMQEAIELNSTVSFPMPEGTILPALCHAKLAKDHRVGNILTVPFAVNGVIQGAVLAERPSGPPFENETIESLEHIASMIGPVLEVRRRDALPLPKRVKHSVSRSVSRRGKSSNTTIKLLYVGLLAALGVILFSKAEYRVTGDARLEAQKQRVVVAPQSGYIANANSRPGDIVKLGGILGALDDKDLMLEKRKWASQLDQLKTEYRDALAKHDRSRVSITQAKIAKAKAQLNLVDEQLSRIQLTAPFNGLVVSGDLSQALGSPVERGQVLFTVAPLDTYRIIINIDERDIAEVDAGQQGSLVLSGMVAQHIDFTIEKVTPVSTTEDGRNYFQVEAKVAETSDLLRPGMAGIAKISIEERKLGWIWSHKLVDWLRLALWSYLP